jgi:2,3-diketo-5-methylthio-1-phosphopentane phosphatase
MKGKKLSAFFDFDNTIALSDTFDGLLPLFSRDARWRKLEERWQAGKIGSLECMKGQIEGLDIDKKRLDRYLAEIKIDPDFKKIIGMLRKKGARIFILSDNFDYLLRTVLSNNNIRGPRILANKIRFSQGRLIPDFPFQNKRCSLCGHCKTKNLLANAAKDSIIIYIGDGRTDICPAIFADVVFAKKALLGYFRQKRLAHIQFNRLNLVYRRLKEFLE